MFELILAMVVASLGGFVGGVVYGSMRSIYVGTKIAEAMILWERIVDKLNSVPRSVRLKVARAKRLGREIDERYL